MTNLDYQVTSGEMSIVFLSTVMSSSIMTAPRTLATELGTPDGWIFSF
ncbi:hypothetical protein [Alkalihalobacterium alkalinitrilicum]|nr:hypothetical protein [Alkalihalobacterium alkalinitrilicum]